MRTRILCLTTLLFAISLATGCQQTYGAVDGPGYHKIIVYGFSSQEEVLTDEIFPAFCEYWKNQTGQEVLFESFFGASEGLTDAIVSGAKADVAILSNEQHALWLRINDLVATDWHGLPNRGIVTRSPLVIVVRSDNPMGIRDWSDLGQPGVQVIHPDPLSSGGAQWAVLAEYGSALLGENGTALEAEKQLQSIWANVVATPCSSCDALHQFTFGAGDALVTYEQDALLAQARGAQHLIVMPSSTIVSEHVAVVVDRNVRDEERDVVEQFVSFLWTTQAQEMYERYYFRPVVELDPSESRVQFHELEHSFTVDELGGWASAYANIIHGAWDASQNQAKPDGGL